MSGIQFNKNLLNEVRGIHKQAYVAPPPQMMGQPPMGQPPMGQPPMGQPPMGQPPMGQPPMGQPPMGPGPDQMAAGPGGQPPFPGDATGGAMPPEMEQLVQMAADALSQGADPNQIGEMLVGQGYPPEIVQQAIEQAMMMLQGPPPGPGGPPGPPPEIPSVRGMMEEKVKEDMSKKDVDPEKRLTMLESKIEVLTDLVESMVEGMPPKTASMRNFYEAQLEALEQEDYYEI